MSLPSLRNLHGPGRVLLLGLLLGMTILFWPTRELRSDNFVFYFPDKRQVIPVQMIGQTKYLPILTILNMVGKVGGLQEKRDSVKVWFGETPLEFKVKDRTVRVDKARVKLANPPLVSNGQWMVPVEFLTAVLPRLTNQVVEYPLGSNRVFIGDVKPTSFTVRLDQLPEGARLTLQFTDKVTIRTVATNGKWVMFLGERPVEPLEPTYSFKDPYVKELHFDDQDGLPKLILQPTSTGLNFYPALVEGGKVLLADVLKPTPSAAQQAQSAPPAAPGATPPTTQPGAPQTGAPGSIPSAPSPPSPPLPVVVLDPGHGGSDNGARARDGVLEKDLDAQVVARVRLALLATQKFRIVLTRTGDVTTSFEQRSQAANEANAVCFLTFHAGDLGPDSPQIALYTYAPPSPFSGPPNSSMPPAFIPWDNIQRLHIDSSRNLATSLQQQFMQIAGVKVDPPQGAPVRALRSINAPAVAIELGRLAPEVNSAPLTSSDFQQLIASAVTRVLINLRGGG
ncbi:MAG: N-acetylmuramoyl-L-alanine amidase [Acidobacteriia bacterium]|nr:N-acetylmuramoyl-L-alanine amidase [Terriglobia bacterium]